MSQSIRIIYRSEKGRVRKNFNWPPIFKRSAVIITAAEWKPLDVPDPSDTSGRPHLGDANVYVTNIGPHDPEGTSAIGGVEFYLHVDFDEPLHVQVTISVLDSIERLIVLD